MSAVPPARRRPPPWRTLLGAAVLAMACAASGPAVAQSTGGNPAPGWSMLDADQKNLLAPFSDQWDRWADGERRAWLALASRFPTMRPAEQLRARERIRQWAELDPQEREIARANFGMARRMPEHQRVEQWQRYRSMTPEQRSVLREHGRTGNTAARFAGPPTGLAREAARPLADSPPTPAGSRPDAGGAPAR
ncbi:MAG: DUF3106 domain-containing protein [Burkholderiaceae bacterium]|jgi:hypothetical protein|nr:DUF3106 domain-containing protein [Burkholderiaceae bacterium]MEB2319974.1 DUF3106 domain-containing protein [Pseudomonadota bacterium]